MPPNTLDNISYQKRPVSGCDHVTPMLHRLSQTHVSIVRTDEQRKCFAADPTFRLGNYFLLPRERSIRLGLVLGIDRNRVMHCRAAISVPLSAYPDVFISSRINQQHLPRALQADAHQVGMSVATSLSHS